MDEDTQPIAARISKSLYSKILKRQSEAKRLSGIEPSISEIIRLMLEEAPDQMNGKRR